MSGPPFRLHVVACDGTSCRDRGSRDTLKALRSLFDDQDFGLYAKVIEGGTVNAGDALELLP